MPEYISKFLPLITAYCLYCIHLPTTVSHETVSHILYNLCFINQCVGAGNEVIKSERVSERTGVELQDD